MATNKATSVEEQLAQSKPETFQATFTGYYFAGTGQGYEKVGFRETVTLPLSWLERDDFSPNGLFRRFLAGKPKVLGTRDGYSGVYTCTLVETSPLPQLPDKAYLTWTTNYTDLTRFARQRNLGIRPDLYPTVDELREAIRFAMEEPEAFAKMQDKRSKSSRVVHLNMEAELAALGY